MLGHFTQTGPAPLSVATRCRPSSASSRDAKKRPGVSVNAASIGQGGSVVSAHPDAVRRREQAAARRAAAQVEAERAQRSEWWESGTPQNMITTHSPDSFTAAIQHNQMVVVEFFAPWCAACRRLFPKLMQLAANNPDVCFINANGGESALSAYVESLGVDRLPFFHFYQGGRLKASFPANLSKISNVRAEIAALRECAEPQYTS